MEARFIGDPSEDGAGPRKVSFRGVEFIHSEWTDVPDEIGAKLKGSNHYEVRGGPLDHDGDGKAGGSLPADPQVVDIPENWRELHWQTLRKLASDVAGAPVANKDEAVALIETELAIRAADNVEEGA